MNRLGWLTLVVGVTTLALGIVSRLLVLPIRGIEAHAFLDFSQACFLLAIALFVGARGD